MREPWEHNSLGVAFDKQNKPGEIELGIGKHRPAHKLNRLFLILWQLHALDTGFPRGVIAATIPYLFWRDAAKYGRRMTCHDGSRVVAFDHRAYLLDDPRQIVRRELIFWLFDCEDAQSGNANDCGVETGDLLGDGIALEVKDSGSKRKVEQGLLAVARASRSLSI